MPKRIFLKDVNSTEPEYIDVEPFVKSDPIDLFEFTELPKLKPCNKSWQDGHVKLDLRDCPNPKSKKSDFKNLDEILNYFFNINLINLIYSQTNKSVKDLRKNDKTIKYIEKNEIYIFIGLLFYMGIDNLPNIKKYWICDNDQEIDLRREYVYSKMSYSRFIFIRSHFRATKPLNNEYIVGKSIENKTTDLINSVNKILHKSKTPEMKLSIDESTVAHKGKCGALVYNKLKPNKWGLKLYILAGANTGYAFKIILYTGKTMPVDEIVSNLMCDYLGKSHHLYFDNFYTTVNNIKVFRENNTYVTGSSRSNRQGLPKELIKAANANLKKGEIILINNGFINGILMQDRRFVILLSSYNSVSNEEYNITSKELICEGKKYVILRKADKVGFINDYNKNMGGVDILDQKIQYYDCNRRSPRWTFKLSVTILNIYASNSYILYLQNKIGKLSRMNFNLKISDWLCQKGALNAKNESCEEINNTNSNLDQSKESLEQVNSSLSLEKLSRGKKSKSDICILETDNTSYGKNFHSKSTTKSRLRCYLCYKNKIITKTNDYCEICKKSLCNKHRCWDKFHYSEKLKDNDSIESSD